ncbi:hypothetical protein Tco_0275071, partial [Tanacetum coccineum]
TSRANPNWAFSILGCLHLTWKPTQIVTMLEQILTGDKYGYIKNHKKTPKNGQARTREAEKYKAEARKVKPQSNHAQQKSTRPNNPIPGLISPRH